MFSLKNTNSFDSLFKGLNKNTSDSRRKSVSTTLWSGGNGSSKGCHSKGTHWIEQRLKGPSEGRWWARQEVSEVIDSSVDTAELRRCIPIRPVTFWAFFLPDILMASFMEISYFPACPRERRPILFLSKGYRLGNRSPLMLCCVFKAGRAQRYGNESVRSCKNECQKEDEGGIGNELCILWDPCVCISPPPPLHSRFSLFFSFFSPGGHESEAGQQPEEESQRSWNSAFGAAWSQAGSYLG